MLKDLLNGLLGKFLGGGSPANVDSNALISGLMGLLSPKSGSPGLTGLIDQFQRKGLGDLVSGWVSTGPNPAISARQVRRGIDPDLLAQFAETVGLDKKKASSKLAEILPTVVDKLTPDGKVPGDNLLEEGLKILKNIL
jgi:uncharacterized protein YidB (DUF937 family)